MSDHSESERKRLEWIDRRTELLAALLLSLATLASSWAGFQAALWDGDQAAFYARAEQTRTEAVNAETVANQSMGFDAFMFSAWLDAYVRGERELETYYRARFRPELKVAFEQWAAARPHQNPDAPQSPFLLPSYRNASRQEASALHRAADALFAEGERANNVSDAFVQATVILALSLFMGGIIQAFKIAWLRLTLLGIGALCWLIGMARILTLPALQLTLGS